MVLIYINIHFHIFLPYTAKSISLVFNDAKLIYVNIVVYWYLVGLGELVGGSRGEGSPATSM